MFLRHTTSEIKERTALTVNPAKTCQPVGAMYAALGVHRCLPHSHGSQGCCSYHRSMLTRHYKEPVMASTSSFTEGSSVFGGQANMMQAIDTIFKTYEPDIIAIHTTCLSETIGDDLVQIAGKAQNEGKVPEGKFVMNTNTPSYVGSHVTGFSNMVRDFAKYFSFSSGIKVKQLNIFPGWVEPGDMREMKRLMDTMGVNYVMLPDTSDVLDAPQTGTHEFYPKGGTTIAEMTSMGDSKFSLACGWWSSRDAAIAVENKCKVKFDTIEIPYGLRATDKFLQAVSKYAGKKIPESITDERGRLMDMITDMHQYLYGKRVALWGDPDQLLPLCEFLVDMDMRPVYVVSGTPGKRFMQRMGEVLAPIPEAKFKNGLQADMFLMHQWIKEEPVDLLIGNTFGKYIARDENIPFVRHGWPIVDRVGHTVFPTVGYAGAMRLLEKILDAFLTKQDVEAPEESFELVL
jgi:nitrogenase molybdenum-iron protein beta chain